MKLKILRFSILWNNLDFEVNLFAYWKFFNSYFKDSFWVFSLQCEKHGDMLMLEDFYLFFQSAMAMNTKMLSSTTINFTLWILPLPLLSISIRNHVYFFPNFTFNCNMLCLLILATDSSTIGVKHISRFLEIPERERERNPAAVQLSSAYDILNWLIPSTFFHFWVQESPRFKK